MQDKWNKISRIWQHKKNYTNKFQIKHNIYEETIFFDRYIYIYKQNSGKYDSWSMIFLKSKTLDVEADVSLTEPFQGQQTVQLQANSSAAEHLLHLMEGTNILACNQTVIQYKQHAFKISISCNCWFAFEINMFLMIADHLWMYQLVEQCVFTMILGSFQHCQ